MCIVVYRTFYITGIPIAETIIIERAVETALVITTIMIAPPCMKAPQNVIGNIIITFYYS